MSVTHYLKKVLPQQRFAAGDIQLRQLCAEVPSDVVEDFLIFIGRKLREAVVLTAPAAAMNTAFVASERQFEKEILQRRRADNAPSELGELPHVIDFDVCGIHAQSPCDAAVCSSSDESAAKNSSPSAVLSPDSSLYAGGGP